MGTRELLTYLEKLEIGLSSFSYEELGVVEAGELKKSFEVFKMGLENKVFGVSEMRQLENIYQKIGVQSLDNKQLTESDNTKFLALIRAMEDTPLSNEQSAIMTELKKLVQNPQGDKAQHSDKNTDSMSTDFEFIEKSLQAGLVGQKIDLKPVLEDCMGQMDLLEELVCMFKQNVWEFIGSAKVNLMSENFAELELACQKIMPSLRMMKTFGLLEVTQQVSRLCKTDKDVKHLTFLYDQFLQEYPRVQEQIDFEMEMFRTM
ncbi:hypothetical protein [Flagellimonas halotolerans]|uniref:Uncharacterized protein n=1 Tax=Flagellimonas halotolerans TaxID=3112164 RepID=A0ABU6IMY7_9FLAO|nr:MULTISPECIES: hypothetical protein [unclassified Allomuricauda]MEC3964598.1 hypothetical protein [Muricauda sp. SYSU M86414]MEC4264467.1 hypothetical protein [Muricauda sp. SYSU M84420]